MNKGGGIGVGSASIVLVFAVLCLTVFSLITFVVAGNTKNLADNEAKLVTSYYEAETLAEKVLAGILEADFVPAEVLGVEIVSAWDWGLDAELVRYSCPISDNKSLYVDLTVNEGSYSILGWRMRDINDWEADFSMDVWLGPDEDAGFWLGPELGLDMLLIPEDE